MSLNDSIKGIVGKKIKGIVAKEGDRHPRNQVFILFDDCTYYEIYGDDIHFAKGIDKGDLESVRKYMSNKRIVHELYETDED